MEIQNRVILTIEQLDKLYEDVMRLYGEPTPAEQEDKILSLENRNEELENLVDSTMKNKEENLCIDSKLNTSPCNMAEQYLY